MIKTNKANTESKTRTIDIPRIFVLTLAIVIGTFFTRGVGAQPLHTEPAGKGNITTQEIKGYTNNGNLVTVLDFNVMKRTFGKGSGILDTTTAPTSQATR